MESSHRRRIIESQQLIGGTNQGPTQLQPSTATLPKHSHRRNSKTFFDDVDGFDGHERVVWVGTVGFQPICFPVNNGVIVRWGGCPVPGGCAGLFDSNSHVTPNAIRSHLRVY